MKKIAYVPLLLLGSLLCAESFTFQEEVRVITSKPEYRMVTTRTPFQDCWDEQLETHYAPQPQNDGSGVVGGLIGGVAGGVLGHQIGGGSGKTAATVGGAIVGTLVGKNLAEQNDRVAPPPTYRTERRCTTRYEEKSAEKFMGYRNTANYKGQSIVKYSDQPLEFIHMSVTVSY